LNSFQMAISWYETATVSTVDLTAHFQGGGTSTQTLNLIPALQTYNLNLQNVLEVDLGVMNTGGGYWAMDNVNYDTATSVPEPATFALIGAAAIAAVIT